MKYCNHCGNPLKPDARFCGSCGMPLPENSNPPIIPSAREPIPTNVEPFNMKNSQRRISNLWWILLFVFAFCMVIPSITGLDGFDGGFALIFVAGFMVIMSFIIALIYRSRAKQLDKILSGEGRIIVWRYAPDEWQRFVENDFKEEKQAKKFLFFLIAGISIVVGVILWIAVKDILIFFIALGIIPIVALPAFIVPRARYSKLMNSEPKALIAQKGTIVGKMFHLWVKMGARLDEVSIDTEEEPAMLVFQYSIPTRNGRQTETARIPVPRGKLNEAEQIKSYFITYINS